ncbi:hypothetical protein MRX96_042201 [Rhipicephalus microplus]
MPTPHQPPAIINRVTRTGFRSPPAASRSFFGVKHIGAAPGLAASSWHPGVYWRFCGSVGPFSLSTTRHSPGRIMTVYLPVPGDAVLPLSGLRGLPSPHIIIASDCPRGGPTWSESTRFGQRGVSTSASPVMPG